MTRSENRNPVSVRYIITSEFAERISYYSIQAILVIFMTTRMLARDGSADPMPEHEAIAWYHWFVSISMFLPILGGLLADALWGKYRTILLLSLLYSAGHAALAIDETRVGLAVGLLLIALGSGGIKACVPALLGDQFTAAQAPALSRIYAWYFWILNLGSLVATLAAPLLLVHAGPSVAFGVPCLLMLASTYVFWLGRGRCVRVPPAGLDKIGTILSWRSLRELRGLAIVFLLIVPSVGVLFITNSAMVLQAAQLDLDWLGIRWLPAQVFAFNPFFSLLFIPLFATLLYPAIARLTSLTPLRKIGAGFVMTMAGLLLLIWLQLQINAGAHPSIGWHVLVLAIFVAAEILIHITAMEYAYLEAPVHLRSVAMSFRFVAMAFGNAFVATASIVVGDDGNGGPPDVSYYLFFLVVVAASLGLFVLNANRIRARAVARQAAERPAG